MKLKLSGNALKLLALLFMTVDHLGLMLFPQELLFRCIGRLAMPIFAYMIAEGCRHTKSKGRYLLRLAAVAVVCQLVYFFALRDLLQCIFVTFSMSIALIWLFEAGQNRGGMGWLYLAPGIFAAWFICRVLPDCIPGFAVDYSIFGVLLPVFVYLGQNPMQRISYLAVGLVLLCLDCGGIQWLSLLSIPLLLLYDGSRGKARLKYFFYLYYPAHLVVIWLLAMFL